MKLCLTSSSGGHYEQLLMLRSLAEEYQAFILTEKTSYNQTPQDLPTYYLRQVNRHSLFFIFPFLANIWISFKILWQEKPDVVISTGVLSTIPMCLLAKMTGKKLIYIEFYAKVESPTLTGKLLYPFADLFYVQWPQMLKIFPNAKYIGGIY